MSSHTPKLRSPLSKPKEHSESSTLPRLLYVDDEQGNLLSFKYMFEEDFQIWTATSGEEGLKIVHQEDIQLVLSDQRMPGMQGVEFLKAVRNYDPEIIRILVTGYSSTHTVVEAINDAQVFHFIAKPWKEEEIRNVLQRGLEAQHLKQEKSRLLGELFEANADLHKKTKQLEEEILEREHAQAMLHQLNTNLEERVRQRTAELRVANETLAEKERNSRLIRDVASETHAAKSVEDAYKVALQLVGANLGLHCGFVFRVAHEHESASSDCPQWELAWCWERGCPKETQSPIGECISLSTWLGEHALHGLAVAQGRPVWVDDFSQNQGWSLGTYGPKMKAQSGLAFPVVVDDEPVAVVELLGAEVLRVDSTVETILTQVASQLHLVERRERIKADQRIARELAESASQAKSTFLASMSHELRTPLNAILGKSYRLKSTALQPFQRREIQDIRVAAKSLLGLINEVLDLSRIEADKMDLEMVPFFLNDVLNHVSSVLAYEAFVKGLELVFDVSPALPQALLGDPYRLQQILINLVQNAIKFTTEGEVVVRVECKADHGDTIELQWWVQDTGSGMSPEQCIALFEPFAQADSSSSRAFGGAGLGLSICQRLVLLMHGSIWATSELEKGTTYHISMPMRKQSNAPETLEASEPLSGLHWVVVESHPTCLSVLTSMLRSLACQVSFFEHWKDAISFLSEGNHSKSIDGLILDWSLEQESSSDALYWLRSNPSLQSLPVIVLGNPLEQSSILPLLESNMVQTSLQKPLLPDQIVNAIERTLNIRNADTYDTLRSAVASNTLREYLKGVRVLVVDEQESHLQISQDILSGWGIEVDTAIHGWLALEMLKHKPYNAVLLDLQMSRIDGYETFRRIRQRSDLDHLVVIALSSNVSSGEQERALQVGMTDYVGKPIAPNELLGVILKWLHTDIANPVTPLPQNLFESSAEIHTLSQKEDSIPYRQVVPRRSTDTTEKELPDLSKLVPLASVWEPVVKNNELRHLFGVLRTLLQSDDSQARDCLETILQHFQDSPLPAELQRVERWVRRYEFSKALDALQELPVFLESNGEAF
ncbi:MAG: response regulator [Deltaproteobacteria bacterium]|nr:MAG: response regulator [Deltaproteobacteria bacterium]